MARWILNENHYIHCKVRGEVNEWERKETDRITGRENRKRYIVPMYCETGLTVCRPGSERRDDNGELGPITFEGPPTPAMEPLDDEAREISAGFAEQWKHPIDSLPGQGFADGLLESLNKQLASIAARIPAPAATPAIAEGVSKEEFEALKEQLARLMSQVAGGEVEELKVEDADEVVEPKPKLNRRVA